MLQMLSGPEGRKQLCEAPDPAQETVPGGVRKDFTKLSACLGQVHNSSNPFLTGAPGKPLGQPRFLSLLSIQNLLNISSDPSKALVPDKGAMGPDPHCCFRSRTEQMAYKMSNE